jgi:hypothetical protein
MQPLGAIFGLPTGPISNLFSLLSCSRITAIVLEKKEIVLGNFLSGDCSANLGLVRLIQHSEPLTLYSIRWVRAVSCDLDVDEV